MKDKVELINKIINGKISKLVTFWDFVDWIETEGWKNLNSLEISDIHAYWIWDYKKKNILFQSEECIELIYQLITFKLD